MSDFPFECALMPVFILAYSASYLFGILGFILLGSSLLWGAELSEFARRFCFLIIALTFVINAGPVLGQLFPHPDVARALAAMPKTANEAGRRYNSCKGQSSSLNR